MLACRLLCLVLGIAVCAPAWADVPPPNVERDDDDLLEPIDHHPSGPLMGGSIGMIAGSAAIFLLSKPMYDAQYSSGIIINPWPGGAVLGGVGAAFGLLSGVVPRKLLLAEGSPQSKAPAVIGMVISCMGLLGNVITSGYGMAEDFEEHVWIGYGVNVPLMVAGATILWVDGAVNRERVEKLVASAPPKVQFAGIGAAPLPERGVMVTAAFVLR